MAISIDNVIDSLNLVGVDPVQKKEVIKKIQQLIDEEKAEKAATREKKKTRDYVICLKSPEDLSKFEIVGTVISVAEGENPDLLLSKLTSACVDNNLKATKKKNKIYTFSDALFSLKNKFLKNYDLKRNCGKEWSRAIQIKEELVKETSEL